MLIEALMWGAGGIIALSIMLKVPGLEVMIRPVFQMLQKLIEYIAMTFGSWLIWTMGGILRAHKDVAMHLMRSEEDYDIRLKIDRANRES